MLEHAGYTNIVDTNIVDSKIQPIKASKRSSHADGDCGGIELERGGDCQKGIGKNLLSK